MDFALGTSLLLRVRWLIWFLVHSRIVRGDSFRRGGVRGHFCVPSPSLSCESIRSQSIILRKENRQVWLTKIEKASLYAWISSLVRPFWCNEISIFVQLNLLRLRDPSNVEFLHVYYLCRPSCKAWLIYGDSGALQISIDSSDELLIRW